MKPDLEYINLPLEQSIKSFVRKDCVFDFQWHYHPQYELTLITSGNGRRFVGDSIENYTTGDLVLLGPYLPHTWSSENSRILQKENEAVVVHFSQDWVNITVQSMPELESISTMLGKCTQGIFFEGEIPKQAAKQLTILPQQAGLTRITSLLHILDTLSKDAQGRLLASEQFTSSAPVVNQRVDKVCSFINENFQEPITQQNAAELIGMSQSVFSRFFKRSTGRTFTHYLHEIRIGYACKLLMETDRDITTICFDCGFGNLSNFNRIFLRLKNLPPHKFRKAYIDNSEL